MKTIHRYTLAITDRQDIPMPSGAIPLHLAAGCLGIAPGFDGGLANNHPVIELWCAVDTELPTVPRNFAVVSTGHPADVEPFTYIGTAVHELAAGRGVWHVFDLGEEPDD